MTYVEDLWQTMFKTPITKLELHVMSGVSKYEDRESRVTTLAAILVRMLYIILIENPASPFRILSNFGKAMEENRRRTVLITKTYERIQEDLADLRGTVELTERVLLDARDMAKGRSGGYHDLYGHLPVQLKSCDMDLDIRVVGINILATFVGVFLGCTVSFMIFLG